MFVIKGKRSNGELLVLCKNPSCNDNSGHLCINMWKKAIYCFKCGYSRKLTIDEVIWLNNARMSSYRDNYYHHKRTIKDRNSDLVSLRTPPDTRLGTMTLEYAKKRGIDPSIYDVYYSNTVPFYLIFKSNEGWWQGRAIKEEMRPKNLFPRDIPKDAMWYVHGSPTYNQIILCEGIMDAIALRKKERLSIALLGSELKKGQLGRIANIVRDSDAAITVMLDSDMNHKAIKIASIIKNRTFAEIVKYVTWEDVDKDNRRVNVVGDPDSITHQLRERLIGLASHAP